MGQGFAVGQGAFVYVEKWPFSGESDSTGAKLQDTECDEHYAKTNLSKLLKQAESGEEVIIARSGQRFQLQVVTRAKPKFGTLRGKVKAVRKSLLFAMPDDESDAFIEGWWQKSGF